MLAALRAAVAASAALAMAPASSSGAGFALEQGSARGNANAAALMAKGGEPSAQYWNAANLTSLDGTQVEASVAGIRPAAQVKTVNPYTGEGAGGKGDNHV